MRKIIFILVLFLAAAFVYLSFGELESVVETLQHGNFLLLNGPISKDPLREISQGR